jgi:hypothetical protein
MSSKKQKLIKFSRTNIVSSELTGLISTECLLQLNEGCFEVSIARDYSKPNLKIKIHKRLADSTINFSEPIGKEEIVICDKEQSVYTVVKAKEVNKINQHVLVNFPYSIYRVERRIQPRKNVLKGKVLLQLANISESVEIVNYSFSGIQLKVKKDSLISSNLDEKRCAMNFSQKNKIIYGDICYTTLDNLRNSFLLGIKFSEPTKLRFQEMPSHLQNM